MRISVSFGKFLKMKRILFSLAFSAAFMLNAQVTAPQASPESTVKQVVGLSEITVDYSRPSTKDRKIFGDLVPLNQLWRTGANGSTDITFSSDVSFGGVDVKAGKYALYTIPTAGDWEVILYRDTEQWGSPEKLDDKQVAARTKVKSQQVSPKIETFTIGFDAIHSAGADLMIGWENTVVKVPLKVDSKKQVLASIEKTMNGPSANDYHQAANYYFEEKMDLDQALEWSKKATDLRPDSFWMMKLQSEIYAAKGDYKNAVSTANKSIEAAKKAGNDGYVKMNEENIKKWNK